MDEVLDVALFTLPILRWARQHELKAKIFELAFETQQIFCVVDVGLSSHTKQKAIFENGVLCNVLFYK